MEWKPYGTYSLTYKVQDTVTHMRLLINAPLMFEYQTLVIVDPLPIPVGRVKQHKHFESQFTIAPIWVEGEADKWIDKSFCVRLGYGSMSIASLSWIIFENYIV